MTERVLSSASGREAAAGGPARPKRIATIDQLRGYAIFGMIVVNYIGSFKVMPWIFHHNKTGFSYADTIAPLFIFVVGMGFRLSLKRWSETLGAMRAHLHAAKRYAILFILGVAFYGPAYHIDWWDALTDIGLGGLLALPFINKKTWVRVTAACGYMIFYMGIYMGTGYGTEFMRRSMNGGPMGPFSWVFILLFGTIAYDLIATHDRRKIVTQSLAWGVGLSVLGWILVPLFKDWGGEYYAQYGPFWPLSKRWCIAPSMIWSTGLCFLTFLLFYWINDILKFQFPHLTILGENPLIIYVLQYSLLEMNHTYVDHLQERWGFEQNTLGDIPIALIGFVIFYLFCYACAKRLHDQKIIVKI